MTRTPPALVPAARRAAAGLTGWSVAALALAAVYANPYAFGDAVGVGVPDIGIPAAVLMPGFLALSATLLVWAVAIGLLGTADGARAARATWRRLVAAQARTGWARAAAALLAAGTAWAHVSLPTPAVATLEALAAGEAVVPYQYRALVPWTAGALDALTGRAVPLALLYGALDAAAGVGVWLAVRRFLRPHVGAPGAEGDAARSVAALLAFVPLALGTAAPWRYNALFFPADTLAVAAFALGLALLQERRWRAYYVLFIVATLNRETTCFLTIAWVLAGWGRVPLARAAGHVGAQLALWLGLKAGLATLYAGNPVLPNAGDGLFVLTAERTLLLALAVPAWAYLGLALGGAGLAAFLLRRRVQGTGLGRWLRVVPAFGLGMALVGEVLEVRIYAELTPLAVAVVCAAGAGIARDALGRDAPDGDVVPAAPPDR